MMASIDWATVLGVTLVVGAFFVACVAFVVVMKDESKHLRAYEDSLYPRPHLKSVEPQVDLYDWEAEVERIRQIGEDYDNGTL